MLTHNDYPFSFDETTCENCGGICCEGSNGSVWITTAEVKKLAQHLNITFPALVSRHLHKDKHRFVFNDKLLSDDKHTCTFFDTDKRQCSIYEVRPDQCKTFPFWEEYKTDFNGTLLICPGITFK